MMERKPTHKEKMIMEAYMSGKRVRSICSEFEVSNNTLYRILKEEIARGGENIRENRKNTKDKKIKIEEEKAKIIELLDRGLNIKEISKELGYHLSTAYDKFRKYQLRLPTITATTISSLNDKDKQLTRNEFNEKILVPKILELEAQGFSRAVISKRIGISQSTIRRKIIAYEEGKFDNKRR